MSKGKNSISQLAVKAMGIFGGVQVVGIVCAIIRNKLVSMWLGPVGFGLFGLYNQALEMINTATNLSIRQSSVRDISQHLESGDKRGVARMIAVVRRWSLWLGLAGALLTCALAPLLSRITFGDSLHVWGFVALSAAVLLMAVTNGEYAVQQGTAKLKRLASVTLWGTIGGLLVSIPMFYWLRQDSVLPSIIAYAACLAIAALVVRKNSDFPTERVERKETFALGKDFVTLGIFMTVGNFVTMLAAYVFNAWLNNYAGTAQVGFYQAGYTLVNKYTGLVLTALGMEYYPRLARVAKNGLRTRVFVSQEINIVMMVMAPVVVLFMALRQPIVWILYTEEFAVILTFVSWCLLGMIFRALSWSIAFVILARGNGKVYLVTESLSAIIGLALNIGCYMRWGLNGLGISFVAWYAIYTIIVAVVYRGVFRLKFSRGCALSVIWTLAVTGATLIAVEAGHPIATWTLIAVAIIVAAWQALRVMRR